MRDRLYNPNYFQARLDGADITPSAPHIARKNTFLPTLVEFDKAKNPADDRHTYYFLEDTKTKVRRDFVKNVRRTLYAIHPTMGMARVRRCNKKNIVLPANDHNQPEAKSLPDLPARFSPYREQDRVDLTNDFDLDPKNNLNPEVNSNPADNFDFEDNLDSSSLAWLHPPTSAELHVNACDSSKELSRNDQEHKDANIVEQKAPQNTQQHLTQPLTNTASHPSSCEVKSETPTTHSTAEIEQHSDETYQLMAEKIAKKIHIETPGEYGIPFCFSRLPNGIITGIQVDIPKLADCIKQSVESGNKAFVTQIYQATHKKKPRVAPLGLFGSPVTSLPTLSKPFPPNYIQQMLHTASNIKNSNQTTPEINGNLHRVENSCERPIQMPYTVSGRIEHMKRSSTKRKQNQHVDRPQTACKR